MSENSERIVDCVSTTNTMTVALAPAMAMGGLYKNIANSMAMSASNAVFAQQQTQIVYQSTTSLGVKMLLP